MSLFQARNESVGEATDLAFRGQRLLESMLLKQSAFERAPATKADVAFGRAAAEVAQWPFADLDETAKKLERYIAGHGCCTVRVVNGDIQLTDLLQQMRSAQADLQPYRALIK